MTKDAELYIVKCEQCIQFKSKPQQAEMDNILATYSLQLVHLDYLTIKMTEDRKDAHVLFLIVHFMRYTQALVTSSQTAKCTAQSLWD